MPSNSMNLSPNLLLLAALYIPISGPSIHRLRFKMNFLVLFYSLNSFHTLSKLHLSGPPERFTLSLFFFYENGWFHPLIPRFSCHVAFLYSYFLAESYSNILANQVLRWKQSLVYALQFSAIFIFSILWVQGDFFKKPTFSRVGGIPWDLFRAQCNT